MTRGQRRPARFKALNTDQGTSGTFKSTRPTSMIIGSQWRWDTQLLQHAGNAQPLQNMALFDAILSLNLMPIILPSLRDSSDLHLSASLLVVPAPPSYVKPVSWIGKEVPAVGIVGRGKYGSNKPHSIIFSRRRNRHSSDPLESLSLHTLLSTFIPLVIPLLSQDEHLEAYGSVPVNPDHLLPIRYISYASPTTKVTPSTAQGRHDREDAGHGTGTRRRSVDMVPPASRGVSAWPHPKRTLKVLSLSELLVPI